jgi:hypothetical protein
MSNVVLHKQFGITNTKDYNKIFESTYMQNLDQTSWDACGFHTCQMVKKYLNLHMCKN